MAPTYRATGHTSEHQPGALATVQTVPNLSRGDYEDLLASLDGIVWEGDARTFEFSYVSQQAERLLGYPTSRWVSEPTFWRDHMHPDDRDRAMSYCALATAEKRAHTFEYRMLAADGRVVWLRDIVAVVVEESRPVKLRGVMVDITDQKRADEQVGRSEERFRALIEHGSDVISLLDRHGTIIYVSPSAERFAGYQPEEIVGRDREQYLHPDDRESFSHQMAALVQRPGASFTYRCRVQHRDGSWRWLEAIATNLLDEPAVEAVVVNARDVTVEVEAQQHLEQRVLERTHEIERRREVAEGLRDLLATVNSRGTLDEVLEYVVAQAGRLLGSEASAIYVPVEDGLMGVRAAHGLDPVYAAIRLAVGVPATGMAFQERRATTVSDVVRAMAEPGDPRQDLEVEESASHVNVLFVPERLGMATRHPVWRRGAAEVGFEALLAVPLVVKDETYGALTLYFREPRKFSEDEVALATAFGDQAALAIENARLYEQAQQAATLEERQRLARELHDSVTQTLFSASLIAEALPGLQERRPEEARRRLQELRELTRGALAEMRTLLLELRPATLTEVGLDDLLRQLAEAVVGRARLPVSVDLEGCGPLPADVQVAAFRLAQEALNNVARHAQAERAAIYARYSPDRVELRISDDGSGFDPAAVRPGHMGLGGMRERAASIGADLAVTSRPGEGTEMRVVWPAEMKEGV